MTRGAAPRSRRPPASAPGHPQPGLSVQRRLLFQRLAATFNLGAFPPSGLPTRPAVPTQSRLPPPAYPAPGRQLPGARSPPGSRSSPGPRGPAARHRPGDPRGRDTAPHGALSPPPLRPPTVRTELYTSCSLTFLLLQGVHAGKVAGQRLEGGGEAAPALRALHGAPRGAGAPRALPAHLGRRRAFPAVQDARRLGGWARRPLRFGVRDGAARPWGRAPPPGPAGTGPGPLGCGDLLWPERLRRAGRSGESPRCGREGAEGPGGAAAGVPPPAAHGGADAAPANQQPRGGGDRSRAAALGAGPGPLCRGRPGAAAPRPRAAAGGRGSSGAAAAGGAGTLQGFPSRRFADINAPCAPTTNTAHVPPSLHGGFPVFNKFHESLQLELSLPFLY